MLSCRQATQLLSESQDRRLDFGERVSVRMHLAICAACRNFGKQLQTLRRGARVFAKSSRQERGD